MMRAWHSGCALIRRMFGRSSASSTSRGSQFAPEGSRLRPSRLRPRRGGDRGRILWVLDAGRNRRLLRSSSVPAACSLREHEWRVREGLVVVARTTPRADTDNLTADELV